MTTLTVRDIPVSLKCAGTTNCTIPAGLSTHFQGAQRILFGCWVKPTTSFDGVNWRDFLIFRGDSGGSAFAGLFVNNVTNQYAVVGLGAGSGVVAADLNKWAHVIGEIDIPASKVRLWLNGVLAFDYATTFTSNLATVTSVTSFIGDSSAPGFNGHIADAFIQNRVNPVAQAEIDDLYMKGELPSSIITFQWPVKAAIGTALPCLDAAGNSSVIHASFNGFVALNSMYSRDTPMTARLADRIGGNSIFTSGLAGYYRNNTDRLYNVLNGAPIIITSAWARNSNPNTGTSQYILSLSTSFGNTGLLIMKNISRNIAFGGRSVDGDSYFEASCSASSFGGQSLEKDTWQQYIGVLNYRDKTIRGYVNGVAACQLDTGITWAQPSFQVTRGAQEVYAGHSSFFWPGYIDDICIFRTDVVPTDAEIREFYLKGLAGVPPKWAPALILDMEDFGPDLLDKSGNGVDFNPASIANPYGLHPVSYMP